MKRLKYIFYCFSAILIIVSYLSLGQASRVSASCSAPSLYLETPGSDPKIKYSHGSPIVINDSLNSVDDDIYASAFSNCSGSQQFYFNIAYWTGSSWSTYSETAWQIPNYNTLYLVKGVRQYSVGSAAWTEIDGVSPTTYKHLYAMTKTSSSSSVTSTSAQLSWSLRMNHYYETSCDATCTNRVQFYLLVGKSSTILTDRTTAAGESGPIGGFQQDYDSSTQRITYAIDNFEISNLDPSSTYYWRIRGDHPLTPDSFFAGGSFNTPAAAPQDLPPPDAGEVLDQSQIGLLTLDYSSGNIYQTFTAGVTGNISKVALKVTNKHTTGNLVAAVVDAPGGIPGSTLLSNEVSIPASSIASSPDYGVVVFNFTTRPLLTAGQTYAIRIRNSDADSYSDFAMYANGNNLYPGGKACRGTSCSNNYDFYFGTYMTNVTPTASPTPSPSPTPAPPLTTSNCQPQTTPNPAIARVVSGLITVGNNTTTGNLSSTNGQCIIDRDKVPFAPDKIPSFEGLQSIYYNQK